MPRTAPIVAPATGPITGTGTAMTAPTAAPAAASFNRSEFLVSFAIIQISSTGLPIMIL